MEKFYLSVPFDEKDIANTLGTRKKKVKGFLDAINSVYPDCT